MAEAKITADHDEIRKWAEQRGGRPRSSTRTTPPTEKAQFQQVDRA